jgi:hypothetical protein
MRPSKYISIWKVFDVLSSKCSGTSSQVTTTRSGSCIQLVVPR